MDVDPKNILCIDDDEDILRLEKLALESAGGVKVFTCTTGKEALMQIEKIKPDIILLDAIMPNLDGLSILKILQKNCKLKTVPVIVVTAKAQRAEIEKYIVAGAVGVIAKPFDPITLMQQIKMICQDHGHHINTEKALADEAIQFLRKPYLKQIQAYQSTLNNFLTHSRKHSFSEKKYQLLQQFVHKLTGSSTTYGFSEIGQAASELKKELEKEFPADMNRLTVLLNKLLIACRDTISENAHILREPVQHKKIADHSQEKPNLLIVAPDSATVDPFKRLLKNEATILVAHDLEEIQIIIEKNVPYLALIVETADMDGLPLLEALQEMNIPVLIITTKNQPDEAIRYIMAGAADYISTPFSETELLEKIRFRLQRCHTTIMIVDDDQTICELLTHKFYTAGYPVISAKDGQSALALIKKHTPQLIILDRMMPGLDGLALLQKLKQDPLYHKIPVLFLTAKRQEEDILEGFKFGAAEYMVKPFFPEEVLVRGIRLLSVQEKLKYTHANRERSFT